MARLLALNLGCGDNYIESTDEINWVNLDNGNCRKDVSIDLEKTPYSEFENDTFDRIQALQVLEHISRDKFIDVIRELYRISNDGALWLITVPYGLSNNFITDPTHKMPFSMQTFDYFTEGMKLRENGKIYGWGDIKLAHFEPAHINTDESVCFTLKVIK
jgi:cyclopropane fatty-acyl-phospholipid synthase-like methyltransferase